MQLSWGGNWGGGVWNINTDRAGRAQITINTTVWFSELQQEHIYKIYHNAHPGQTFKRVLGLVEIFFGPKIFFWPKIFFEIFFRLKLFFENFSDPKFFWTQNFFWPKIFLGLKFFWTQNFWTQNLFGPTFFLGPHFFWTQYL